jgi:hypothetical protein
LPLGGFLGHSRIDCSRRRSLRAQQKIGGFRNIAHVFGGEVIHHGANVMPLPRERRELAVQYSGKGVPWDTTKFMEHNFVSGLLVLHRGRIVLERYGLGRTEHDQWCRFPSRIGDLDPAGRLG